MGKVLKTMGALTAAAMLTACASSPDKIQTASVSKLQYKNYDCEQIAQELDRVNRRAGELHASLKDEADSDSAEMAIGLVLFWPALFFLEGGDGPAAQEYARIKGEREALEATAVEKKCSSEGSETSAKADTQANGQTNAAGTNPGSEASGQTEGLKAKMTVDQRLSELKKFKDDGLISQEQYDERRAEILKEI